MCRLLTALAFPLLLASCASDKKNAANYAADKVVARSDGLEKRPDWVSETVNVKENGENFLIIGVAEVPADSRVQAAYKMSDASSRGNLANKVETQVTKIVESSESGLSMEDQSLKSLIREVSQTSFKNLDVKDRYWEKVVKTLSSGEETSVLKVFSLLQISKSEFKKLLLENAHKSKTGSKEIRNGVENAIRKQWTDESLVDDRA